MEKIEWGESIQSGIPEIDQRNKQFVDGVNQLIKYIYIQAERETLGICRILSDFADYASRHFRHEEAYLHDKLNDLEYSDHRDRHLFFEGFLRDPVFQNDDVGQCDIEELSDFLAEWVDFHIRHLDKNIRP